MAHEAKPIRIERYDPTRSGDWTEVLRHARNGAFLFERAYMDYHGERFTDISLLAYEGNHPVALMPAAIDGDGVVTSHPGLTFGGVVVDRRMRSGQAIEVFAAMCDRLRELGARRCRIKALPATFAAYPSADLEYAYWRRGFSVYRRDLSSLLPLRGAPGFNAGKTYGVKKARKAGLVVSETDIPAFHGLLRSVLQERHGAEPVHTLAEIELLKSRFPQQIFCRCALNANEVVAGALVYSYGHVWHTQYLASSAEGRESGALDLVVAELIREAGENGVDHLSFGASTLQEGRAINDGLLWQKESYGARAIVHDFYEGVP